MYYFAAIDGQLTVKQAKLMSQKAVQKESEEQRKSLSVFVD